MVIVHFMIHFLAMVCRYSRYDKCTTQNRHCTNILFAQGVQQMPGDV